jgi:hypothetical protein
VIISDNPKTVSNAITPIIPAIISTFHKLPSTQIPHFPAIVAVCQSTVKLETFSLEFCHIRAYNKLFQKLNKWIKMAKFKLNSDFDPAGDQPKAVKPACNNPFFLLDLSKKSVYYRTI